MFLNFIASHSETQMTSIPTSTWGFAPNRTKTLFFPPKRFKSLKPLPASSIGGTPEEEPEASDPVKLALVEAEAYRKSKKPTPIPDQNLVPDTTGDVKGSVDTAPEVPVSVKLAMEKAREYKKNQGVEEKPSNSGQEEMNIRNTRERLLTNKVSKKEQSNISSIDFLGLGFSEKKSYRGMPPGLAPIVEPLLDGEVPEVELIVGDASKFEVTTPPSISSNEDADNMGLYKPKVSTWGVFPRPSNISKTFGGGRVIRPGEVLETVEDKAAKEKRSGELIATYKSKKGLTIDAKTKSECEKALKEGDNLMDLGKLREALPYYEKVMKDVIFQSELHGLAALQWSICQDSLSRYRISRAAATRPAADFAVAPVTASQELLHLHLQQLKPVAANQTVEVGELLQVEMQILELLQNKQALSSSILEEARVMYEKLQSHPNVQVSKKARQFVFSFQAMEMMKVRSSSFSRTTGYENYFEAFVENKANYTPTEEEQSEGVMRQALPYIMFLVSPVFIVLLIAIRKSF